ncbi:hypothetical protein [Piscirickettsia salmonis]|uniref:hypothetical protein n=1 Tax=Piscirickettsia salmonis TaxID=1238 RepID=UPI0007C8DC0C
MLGDFASLDVQNTYRGSDAYVKSIQGAKATISGVELYRILKKKQMHAHQDKPAYEQFYLLAA